MPIDRLQGYTAARPREQLYLAAGYPETRARVLDYSTKRLDVEPYGIVCPDRSDPRYDPKEFVLLDFDQKKEVSFVGREGARRFPNPQGMSGALVWALQYDEGWHPFPFVVGIVIPRKKPASAMPSKKGRT